MAQSTVIVEVKAVGAEGTAMTTCAHLTPINRAQGPSPVNGASHSGQDFLPQLPNQVIRITLNKHGLTSKGTC